MSKRIYKYELFYTDPMTGKVTSEINHLVPVGATALYVAKQGKKSYVWLMVNPDEELDSVTFYCIGTGQEVPEGLTYIGTIVEPTDFVFHYFWYPN